MNRFEDIAASAQALLLARRYDDTSDDVIKLKDTPSASLWQLSLEGPVSGWAKPVRRL
jgi:hypothetical protein